MTDEQIIDVLKKRAALAGKNFGYKNPKIVLKKLYTDNTYSLCVLFEDSSSEKPLAFFKDTQSAIFKIDIREDKDTFHDIYSTNLIKIQYNLIMYDPKHMPDCINHKVAMSIIEMLKSSTIGLGFVDIKNFGTLRNKACMISPDETYESISIEADLDVFNGI